MVNVVVFKTKPVSFPFFVTILICFVCYFQSSLLFYKYKEDSLHSTSSASRDNNLDLLAFTYLISFVLLLCTLSLYEYVGICVNSINFTKIAKVKT